MQPIRPASARHMFVDMTFQKNIAENQKARNNFILLYNFASGARNIRSPAFNFGA
jgi:hypothetical protein